MAERATGRFGAPDANHCQWLSDVSQADPLVTLRTTTFGWSSKTPSRPLPVRRIQAVVATMGSLGSNSRHCMAWAGVIPPSVLRGRALSSVATSSRRSGVCTDRSVPLGKYWRNNPCSRSILTATVSGGHRLPLGDPALQQRDLGEAIDLPGLPHSQAARPTRGRPDRWHPRDDRHGVLPGREA